MSPRRLRLNLLVSGVIGAVLLLSAWTQPWYEVVLTDGQELSVRGQDAAPALSGIALAALALVAALAIARHRVRLVLGALQIGIGALATVIATPLTLTHSSAAVAAVPVITAATGVSGASARLLIADLSITVWAYLALAGCMTIAVTGLAIMASSRGWPAPTVKYDQNAAKPDSNAGAWDALSEGDDPTS